MLFRGRRALQRRVCHYVSSVLTTTESLSFVTAVRLVPRFTPHHPRRSFGSSVPSRSDHNHQSTSSVPSHSRPDTTRLAKHLEDVFPPLHFPPDLAARILTHASHKDAIFSHNARLSFIGMEICYSIEKQCLMRFPSRQVVEF